MTSLFILGNGFDLAHKLPTSYQHFNEYLKSYYPDASEITPSFNISSNTLPDGGEEFDEDEVVAFITDIISETEGEYWCDIENTLGKLDFNKHFDQLSYLFDGSDDKEMFRMAYRYEDISSNFKRVVLEIKKLFSNWVNTISINQCESIPVFEKLFSEEESLFLTFNYTPVLEDVYGIAEPYHIHGLQFSEIIIGHGSEYLDDVHRSYIGTEFALFDLHNRLRKDTFSIIEQSKDFFDNLNNIKKIYSFGFSFSEVDLPYIREICKNINTANTTWYLSDYESEMIRNNFIQSITNCGFEGDFALFSIKEEDRATTK